MSEQRGGCLDAAGLVPEQGVVAEFTDGPDVGRARTRIMISESASAKLSATGSPGTGPCNHEATCMSP